MKKVLITSTLYKPNIGGIENSLYYIAKAYIDAGFEVHLVASSVNHYNKSLLKPYEESDGLKIYRYKGNSFTYRNIQAIRLYKKLLKSNNYSSIICRTHEPVIMLRLAGAEKVNYILAGVSYKQNAIKSKLLSRSFLKRIIPHLAHHTLQYISVRLATKNYVFSKNMEMQMRKYLKFKKPIDIVKPGIDHDKFKVPSQSDYNYIREKIGFLKEDILLLGVGRFEDVKGFDYLIKSLRHLPINYKLLLVGDGSNRKKYTDLLKNLNLQERIKIIGPVQDTSDFYKAADIYVLSSVHETLGQTVLEAMASGLPIVAFDDNLPSIMTSTSEITDSTNSIYAENLSEQALANAIIKTYGLIQDGSFSKNKISNDSTNKYSWSKLIQRIQ